MMRSPKMTRLRRALSLAVLLALVTACGTTADETTTTAGETTTTTGETTTTTGETTTTTAAAGPSWDDIVAAAQAEGELTLYGSIGEPVMVAMAEAFEEAYGITVNFVRRGARETAEAFVQEMSGGIRQVDIVNHSSESDMVEWLDSEWFRTFEPGDLPALTEGWPEEHFRLGSYVFFSVSPHVIYYNTDLVSPEDVPKTWADLNNPAFDGLIGITDPDTSANTQFTLHLIRTELGDEWLREVGDLACCYEGSSTPSAQLVAAGEAAVWFPNTVDPIFALQKEGAPVDYVLPEITSGAERFIAAVENSPSPNAAQLFLNWVMTMEGQTVINGTFGVVSPLPGVPGTIPFPAGYVANDVAFGLSIVDELNALIKPR